MKEDKNKINNNNNQKNKAIAAIIICFIIAILTVGGVTAYNLFSGNSLSGISILGQSTNTNLETNTTNNSSKTNTSNTTVKTVSEVTVSDNYTGTVDLSSLSTSGSGVTVSGTTITISKAGTYYLTGTNDDANIIVDAKGEEVILVLDNVNLTSKTTSVINVVKAEQVTIYLKEGSKNTLTDASTYTVFTSETEMEEDATIYSKADLIFAGEGSLTINANYDKAIHGKDSVQILSGTYVITSKDDAIKGKDYVYIKDGTFTINAGGDGINSNNEEDTSLGYITIDGGTFTIKASSDGIQSITKLIINGGTFDITSSEGLESTLVTINGGKITISASDDGINASTKSTIGTPTITINDGEINITMGSGDTDALDANGNLYINGGTVNITAQFAFDFDKEGKLNGGTVYVNGSQVTEITNSMMMGGGNMGGMQGMQNPGEMPNMQGMPNNMRNR